MLRVSNNEVPEKIKDVQSAVAQFVRLMVDHPETVDASVIDDSVLIVRVAARDLGKVIGVSGRSARALRVLLAAICKTQGVQLTLDVQGTE